MIWSFPNPVIRSHYGKGFIKQYVHDHFCLRTESATNDVTDYGVKKAVESLPQLQEKRFIRKVSAKAWGAGRKKG